ncbi:MAG: aspartate kinase [Clostridia bacterium]|nr:aspartate kinase [Clostridia bacterium]
MLTVIKFGGSSLASREKVENAARIAAREREEGNRVVMVVSAQGDSTDELMSRAHELSAEPDLRELDVLLSAGEQISMALAAIALHELGVPAVSLCGWQAGIVTDGEHGGARVRAVHTERLKRELDAGRVVVAAGFQGIDEKGDITTIGRGGSDTTAAVLAAALGADVCRIYTDVHGVYSADPREITTAVRHGEISYDEMLELASLGAKVLHSRAVDIARREGTALEVLSSFEQGSGTRICAGGERREVTAVTSDAAVAVLRVKPAEPQNVAELLARLAGEGIATDMVTCAGGELALSLPSEQAEKAVQSLREGGGEIALDGDAAKLSAVGAGMAGSPRAAARMLAALRREKIEIKMVYSGEIKTSVVVGREDRRRGLEAIHKEFFE